MPGPYLLHPSGSITKVYRLYWDYNFAFVESVTDGINGTHIPVTGLALTDASSTLSVAVPSRLYYPPPSSERPLSGKRLAVKDLYDVKGLRTSGGNRAYRAMTDPATDTAPALQKLIDLGAVVVGKTKTTQFALGERPTADYVDQLAPFNPRGDGYQHPQVSSCGTGAGVASYEWLDFGTATDTGGSVRLPSQANGLFGMRITNASLPLDGILPLTPIFDTPGLLSRSAKLLQTAYNAWFPSTPYKSYPKRIVLPEEFWPTVNKTSMPIYTSFIQTLAEFLDAEVVTMNTNASFNAYSNTTEGISQYLGLTYSNITNYDQYRLLAVPFKTRYEAKFGRAPYWNPVTRARWTRGASLPLSSYSSATDHYTLYQSWYRSQLTPTCENSLVLYPMGAGTEDYRDTYVSPPSPIFGAGYPGTQMAVMAALPDYTVPIGERTYFSRVTERNETLPVTIGIVGAAGCDGMLMDLVAEMGDKGLLVGEVGAGTSLYN
ncbi:amidase signature enzyme [Pleomassaria siparia CBS 279.74]|uniref:Amidase signature enzyme n=1 Tax=Pleomassaria siparia CBS 279.74 TaxID=1314801 RepID=A0A6G1KN67_9PLEO|nr:amidase signature enzyme [Pleomassaria siparia CBS 279.74]